MTHPTIESLWRACTPDEHRAMVEAVLRTAPVALAHPETAPTYDEFLNAVAAGNNVRSEAFRRYPLKQQRGFAIKVLDSPAFTQFRELAIKDWLLLHHRALLRQLCDAAGVPHEDGMITGDSTPPPQAARAALRTLIDSAPARSGAIYVGFLLATHMSGFGDLAAAAEAERFDPLAVLGKPAA